MKQSVMKLVKFIQFNVITNLSSTSLSKILHEIVENVNKGKDY